MIIPFLYEGIKIVCFNLIDFFFHIFSIKCKFTPPIPSGCVVTGTLFYCLTPDTISQF